MKVAIVSPAKDAYSETFIQAHKNLLDGHIYYLYGGSPPKFAKNKKPLIPTNKLSVILFFVNFLLFGNKLSFKQYAFKKYLKKKSIDCVLAEYGTAGVKIDEVCSQLNIPLIVHFHGYDASKFDVINEHEAGYKRMFKNAIFIISVSNVMHQKLLKLGAPADKLVLNPYGPADRFLKLNLVKKSKKILFGVGRFTNKKAPYYTIFAFKKVLKKHPDARLIIGGKGELWESCKNLVKVLNLEEKIDLPGILSVEEVTNNLQIASAYVQHSITTDEGDMEGTPLGILEASAAGIPVISTFHAGIPDVIVHGKTGLLCKEHDYIKMAEHLNWILEHPEEAQKMGVAGRLNIQNNFSMSKHINKLNHLIEQAINE
jgi:glycosyltransferase involved in cell wall biosynthesis